MRKTMEHFTSEYDFFSAFWFNVCSLDAIIILHHGPNCISISIIFHSINYDVYDVVIIIDASIFHLSCLENIYFSLFFCYQKRIVNCCSSRKQVKNMCKLIRGKQENKN